MRPILFNAEIVKAILDDRKKQFRLPVKIKNKLTRDWAETTGVEWIKEQNEEKYRYAIREENGGWAEYDLKTFIENYSKYKVVDILYVKEIFGETLCGRIIFKADGGGVEDEKAGRWKPSVHLKQKDARIFLKITNVRVERLQDITLADMICEGINHLQEYSTGKVVKPFTQIKREFINLWNSTAKDGYKYEDNPPVFVYEFERIENKDLESLN